MAGHIRFVAVQSFYSLLSHVRIFITVLIRPIIFIVLIQLIKAAKDK